MGIMDYDYGNESYDAAPLNGSGADVALSETEALVKNHIEDLEPLDSAVVAEEGSPAKILGLESNDETKQVQVTKENKEELKQAQKDIEAKAYAQNDTVADGLVAIAKGVGSAVTAGMKAVKDGLAKKKEASTEDLEEEVGDGSEGVEDMDEDMGDTEGVESLNEFIRELNVAQESLNNDFIAMQSLVGIHDRLMRQQGISRSIALEAIDRIPSFPYKNEKMFTTHVSKTFYTQSLESVSQEIIRMVKEYWNNLKHFLKKIFDAFKEGVKKVKLNLSRRKIKDDEIKATKEIHQLFVKFFQFGFVDEKRNINSFKDYLEHQDDEVLHQLYASVYKPLTYPSVHAYISSTKYNAQLMGIQQDLKTGVVESVLDEIFNQVREKNLANDTFTQNTQDALDRWATFSKEDLTRSLGREDLSDQDVERFYQSLLKPLVSLLEEDIDRIQKLMDKIGKDTDNIVKEETQSGKMVYSGDPVFQYQRERMQTISLLSKDLMFISNVLAKRLAEVQSFHLAYKKFIQNIIVSLDQFNEDLTKDGQAIKEALEARMIVLK